MEIRDLIILMNEVKEENETLSNQEILSMIEIQALQNLTAQLKLTRLK